MNAPKFPKIQIPLHWFVVAQWVAILLLTVGVVFAVVLGQNAQAHQNDTLDALICHAESSIRSATYLKPIQKERALRFYSQQIKLEHLKPCK